MFASSASCTGMLGKQRRLNTELVRRKGMRRRSGIEQYQTGAAKKGPHKRPMQPLLVTKFSGLQGEIAKPSQPNTDYGDEKGREERFPESGLRYIACHRYGR